MVPKASRVFRGNDLTYFAAVRGAICDERYLVGFKYSFGRACYDELLVFHQAVDILGRMFGSHKLPQVFVLHMISFYPIVLIIPFDVVGNLSISVVWEESLIAVDRIMRILTRQKSNKDCGRGSKFEQI